MNIKFYTNLENYHDAIIDAFVEEYGEKYRNIITSRYNEVNIYHYITLDGLCEVIKGLEKEIKELKKKSERDLINGDKLTKMLMEDQKELKNLKDYLKAHNNLRKYLFYKHINQFVEKYKNYLTLNDQKIWNDTHDVNKLKNINIILDYKPEHQYNLDLYNYQNSNYINILGSGLLEYFILGNIIDIDKEDSLFTDIKNKQIEYCKITGKSFEETNISLEDLEQLNIDRHNMIKNLLTEYQSYLLGYSFNLCRFSKRKDILLQTLTLDNRSTLAYYMPSIEKIKRKFLYSPYIFFSPTNFSYTQNDHIFMHEITHAINTNIYNDGRISSGFDEIKKAKKGEQTIDRYYVNLNEYLNDYIASRVTQRLHDKGIFIWQNHENKRIRAIDYQKFHFYVEPLYLKYKKELIEYFMTGNLEKIKQILPDDLDELAKIANIITDKFYQTFEKQNANLNFQKYYRLLHTNNTETKKFVKEYHHNIKLD